MKQIFTFGPGHLGGTGFYHYVVVHGRDRSHCRELMLQTFGDKWAFQYDSEERAGVEKYGLILHVTIGAHDRRHARGASRDGSVAVRRRLR